MAPNAGVAQAGMPLGYLPVVALLRDAHGGSVSAYGVLALLPVLWLAFYGTWRQMFAGIAAAGLTFLAPVALIGAPDYPHSELGVGLAWTVVGDWGHGAHAGRPAAA